jgi:hypothetical protein
MKLVVQELNASPITQVITPSRHVLIEAIRPHIYRHNLPAGTVKLQIHDDAAVLVAESEAITITNIGTLAFFHGYQRFYIDAWLAKDQDYTLSLVGTGYSFSESAYVGWVNGHDLAKYPLVGTPASHLQYPYDFEIWERTTK